MHLNWCGVAAEVVAAAMALAVDTAVAVVPAAAAVAVVPAAAAVAAVAVAKAAAFDYWQRIANRTAEMNAASAKFKGHSAVPATWLPGKYDANHAPPPPPPGK